MRLAAFPAHGNRLDWREAEGVVKRVPNWQWSPQFANGTLVTAARERLARHWPPSLRLRQPCNGWP